MNPQEFSSQLIGVFGEKLLAVVLYGSAANGEFHKEHSDYNTIIVLKNIATLEVAKGGKLIKKWVKKGNALPLIFTKATIDEACDVFPIEFIDIIERHRVLHGNDPFSGLKIDIKNLRHQCEHELRSKILSLVSRFAVLSDQPKELIGLILASSSSFFAIFRGILRLSKRDPKHSSKEMLEQIAGLIELNVAIFMEILDVREGKLVWRKTEALEKFEQYLTSLDSVARYVDRF